MQVEPASFETNGSSDDRSSYRRPNDSQESNDEDQMDVFRMDTLQGGSVGGGLLGRAPSAQRAVKIVNKQVCSLESHSTMSSSLMMMMNILTSAISALCSLLFRFIYSSLSIFHLLAFLISLYPYCTQVFWQRVKAGKERPDSLVREVVSQMSISAAHLIGDRRNGYQGTAELCHIRRGHGDDDEGGGGNGEEEEEEEGEDYTGAVRSSKLYDMYLPIVSLFDIFESNDSFILELELMQDVDLFQKLKHEGARLVLSFSFSFSFSNSSMTVLTSLFSPPPPPSPLPPSSSTSTSLSSA